MSSKKIVSVYYSSTTDEPCPERIDGTIMTHLIVGWANVSPDTGACIGTSPDYVAEFRRSTRLRELYPQLKVMLVCGDRASFSKMAKSASKRELFVSTAVTMLEECGFDGLDIDWEFPVFQSKKYDRANFVQLLKDLRTAFDSHSPKFLLTFAGGAQKLVAAPAYDIPAIAPLVDFVNLMCYDYNMFQSYNIWASHNAPLFGRPSQRSIFATLNTVWSAEYWVSQGMPREKVVVGIPTYARAWKLMFPCWHTYNAPCVSSYASGMENYPDVCRMITSGGTRVFDQFADVPFAYKGRQWVSYEDEESIAKKATWIRKGDYGGAMIFCANGDDWKGEFSGGGERFPLIRKVYEILTSSKGGESPTGEEKAHLEEFVSFQSKK